MKRFNAPAVAFPRIAFVRKIPVELSVGLLFGAIFLIGVALGLPITMPTFYDYFVGLGTHFFIPVIVAALLQLIIMVIYGLLKRERLRKDNIDPFTMIKVFPLLMLSVLLYFNFKYWAHLVHPRLYDAELEALDQALGPLLYGMHSIRRAVAALVGPAVDTWYMLLFLGMFFLSLAIHGVFDSNLNQRRIMLGLCFNLLLGGLSYWIMPALGPFIYHTGLNELATPGQQAMYLNHQKFVSTGIVPPGAFTAALGAMPSLHAGHSFYLLLCAYWSMRKLLIFYVPVFIWIAIDASGTGYHYLADIPAGMLLGLISFTLSHRLIRPADQPAAPTAA